ncbi:MAG TPA: type 4a pilus biogenesis protein PilO [Candidatus Eremiobacteraceae bacterium]|nr:type 4a pilus biogenesis protein PilO [Candidatus Eremiobacteraceae bacterium]
MTFLSNPLNRALLMVAVIVAIGLIAFFWIVQPTQNQYAQSQARLAQDQQTYSDLKRVADQKPQYLALTKLIQQRLAGVELTADPRVYIPSYLKQIEKLATDDGLQVTSVTPQAPPTPAPGSSPTPGPIATVNPNISAVAPINSARAAAGAANSQTNTTNGVAAATGATPIPGPNAPAGTQPANSASGKLGTSAPSSARANAIAYLNQSFTQVPINMEFAGTYSELEKFLTDLNKFPKLIGVGNVTLAPSLHVGVGETPTLTITLPIVAYRLSPTQGTVPPPAPLGTGGSGATGNGG